MNNITGQPVEDEDFFDRIVEVESIWSDLQQGNNILLLAPRRVGKTSLTYRVGREAVAKGWKFVFVDVQKDQHEIGFLDNLFQNLKSAGVKVPLLARFVEGLTQVRRNMPKKIEGGGMSVEFNTAEGEASTLEHQIEKVLRQVEESGEPVLIAIDELPVFLEALEALPDGERHLEAFLNWFRALRLRFRKNIRWILLGSVGLDTFTEVRRLTKTINDLQTASLGAFSNEVAAAFLKALGGPKQIEFSDEACAEVIGEIGWPLPFFLQLVFHQLTSRLGRPPRPLTLEEITAACDALLEPQFYRHFEPWRERLAEGLDSQQHKAATCVLHALCQKPAGSSRETLLTALVGDFAQQDPAELGKLLGTIIGVLERDGYILRRDGSYAFRSFLLRRYWFTREMA